jgi:DNA recombination protein RmuC
MEYLLTLVLTLAGIGLGWFLAWRQFTKNSEKQNEILRNLTENMNDTEKQKAVLAETLRIKTINLQKSEDMLAQNLVKMEEQISELSALKAINNNLSEKLETQKAELEEIQKRLTSDLRILHIKFLKIARMNFGIES